MTNQDLKASEEIWRFFSQFDINGSTDYISSIDKDQEISFSVYPNPTVSELQVKLNTSHPVEVRLHNNLGQCLMNFQQESNGSFSIDTQLFSAGLYLLTVNEQGKNASTSRYFVVGDK